jgi:thioredoxin-like negative regulator of GroEL
MACLSLKPIVDGLTAQLGDRFTVLRLDIQSEVGSALADQIGFRSTPQFILLDNAGTEVWRGNGVPADEQLSAAAGEPINTQ